MSMTGYIHRAFGPSWRSDGRRYHAAGERIEVPVSIAT